LLARLRDRAAITRALVIAGDSNARTGPYESSQLLMRTGLLQEHGIRSFGVAGHPEGHRKIGTAALDQAAISLTRLLAQQRRRSSAGLRARKLDWRNQR